MSSSVEAATRRRSEALDPTSPVPLYYQLQELLEHEIESGALRPGNSLPTEKQLGDLYQVSRTTVRQAIDGLALKGLVIKRQGKGTFVARRKVHEELPKLRSFTEEMRARGLTPTTRVVSVKHIRPPEHISQLLELQDDEGALQVRRLRFVENTPILITTSYLPGRLHVSLTEDFSDSLYALLERRYNVKIQSGENIIEATVAGEAEASLLKIRRGSPLLAIRRLALDPDGRPVEYVEGFYRGDRYQYVVKLAR